ncbi:Transcription factor bHLH52 [Cardamine amara subsp. amara]|uniref:Transcription factor bHLH52 n=1 Tax=Cardamine amara subsp. amara TaxID=228776 RepID=A0ABD1AZ84_CARAN
MDCLSYFFNSDLIQLQDCFIPAGDMIIPETDTFFFQAQPQHQLDQPLHHDEALSPSLFEFNHFYEPFLPPQEIFLPSPKPEVFNESQNLDSFFPTPKHQKLINSSFHFNNDQDSLFPRLNSNYLLDSYIPEASNFSEFRVPDFSPAFKVGWSDQGNTKKPELSSQSIAARKRRRRITEKTQELAKLIPGSQKHNTAEMFNAAAKYVKFLQAQIEILRLSETKMQTQESPEVGRELECLLGSQEIQEKLSTEEVCVVPMEIIQILKSEECILRNPKITRDVNNLLSSNLMN